MNWWLKTVYERQWCKIIKDELLNLQSYTV